MREVELFNLSFESGIGIEYFNLNKSVIHNVGKGTLNPLNSPRPLRSVTSTTKLTKTQNDRSQEEYNQYSLLIRRNIA
jgi:hypothetical protein